MHTKKKDRSFLDQNGDTASQMWSKERSSPHRTPSRKTHRSTLRKIRRFEESNVSAGGDTQSITKKCGSKRKKSKTPSTSWQGRPRRRWLKQTIKES